MALSLQLPWSKTKKILVLLLVLLKGEGVTGFRTAASKTTHQLSLSNGVPGFRTTASKTNQLSILSRQPNHQLSLMLMHGADAEDSPASEKKPAFENNELMEGMRSMLEKNNDVMTDKVCSMLENQNDMIADQMQGMKGEIQGMKGEIQGMKGEMQGMKGEMQGMKGEMQGMKGEIQGMKGEIQGMKGEIQGQGKRLSTMEDRTGILVEDKARAEARRLFGDDFSKGVTIKSIHDIIKLISKAGNERVPTGEYGPETDKRKYAENDIVDFLKGLIPSFVKAAARAVLKQSKTDEFQHEVFAEAKRGIYQATQEIFDTESIVEMEDLKQNLGKIIHSVTLLSEATPPDDDEKAAGKRKKLMRGQFMNKLIRINWGLGNEGNALTDCQGPGVLFSSAISGVYKKHSRKEEGNSTGEYDMAGLVHWVAEECDLFKFKEELECDFQGKVTLTFPFAYIVRGEAKSSIKNYEKGMQQMDEQASVIEFALAIIFKDEPYERIFKTYNLFVLEAEYNDQRKTISQKDADTDVVIHVVD